ncbi:MAG: DUF1579 family protein [Planctomycetota bacterium]|nr:DUF1579 family protein [Planctomycetota bacterium]
MSKSLTVVGLVIAFVMGFAGANALQDKEGGHDKASWPPAPLEDDFLDKWVGTWEWEGTMTMDPKAGPMPYKATETFKWALNHQFLVSNYESPMGPNMPTYEGMAIARSTPGSKDYQHWWFDIGGDGEKSEGKRDGNTVVYTAPPKSGKHEGTISTITLNEDGTGHHVYKMIPEGQTEWMTFFDVKGKKK